MLSALKFVAGSVAKKEYVPGLTHFTIENSRVRGHNGTISLCSPIPFDITCNPNAEMLIKAIANCPDSIKLTLTAAGKLSIKSGNFKSLVQCIPEPAPQVEPEGEIVQLDGEAFMKAVKMVAPFIGTDASRLWSHGILIKDQSLFATNNVVLVQYWLGVNFPCLLNIPKGAIKEMLRIGLPPLYLQVAENSVTFHYEGDRWLRTQLYSTEWPDLGKVLNQPSDQKTIDPNIFVALDTVKPFADKSGRVNLQQGLVTTQTLQDDDGAEYIVEGLIADASFNIDMLQLLDGVVKTIDWSTYPAPCHFQNGMLRGAIVGIRK